MKGAKDLDDIRACDDPGVLTKEADAMKRKLKEALLFGKIGRTGRSMNQDKGLEVSKLWLDLI